MRFEEDEIFPEKLLEFVGSEEIYNASFTGIGAFSRARLAYFDVETCRYADREVDDQVEVLSLVGNVARHSEQPLVHAHITLGRRDYTTLGGHLQEGSVRPTLELFLRVGEEPLDRVTDAVYGLPTLELEERY